MSQPLILLKFSREICIRSFFLFQLFAFLILGIYFFFWDFEEPKRVKVKDFTMVSILLVLFRHLLMI
jgi:hypothetical protein